MKSPKRSDELMKWCSRFTAWLPPQTLALVLLNQHGQDKFTVLLNKLFNKITFSQYLDFAIAHASLSCNEEQKRCCLVFPMSSRRYPWPYDATRQTLWGRSKQAIECQQLNNFRGKEKVYVNLDAPCVIKVGRKSYLMISILIAAIQHVFCSFWSLGHRTKIY